MSPIQPTPAAGPPAAAVTPVGKEARQQAAAILEVLAGVRTPAQAAAALAVSLVRYYQMEARALRGLVAACAPAPRGPRPSAATQVSALTQECERLRRELARQQALVRLTQRHLGLPAPAAAPVAGKTSRRRKTVRALTAAARLRGGEAVAAAGSAAPPVAE
jgi:hypothetical protein